MADIYVLANGNSKWVRDVNRIVSGYPYHVTLTVFFDRLDFKAAIDREGKVALVSSYFCDEDTTRWLMSIATIRLYIVGEDGIFRIERTGARTKVTMDEMTSVLILEDLKLASRNQHQIEGEAKPRSGEDLPNQIGPTSNESRGKGDEIVGARESKDQSDPRVEQTRGDSKANGGDPYQKGTSRIDGSHPAFNCDQGLAEELNPIASESNPLAKDPETGFIDIAARWQRLGKGAPSKGGQLFQSQRDAEPHSRGRDGYFDELTEAKFAEYLANLPETTPDDLLAGGTREIGSCEGSYPKPEWEERWKDHRAIDDGVADRSNQPREHYLSNLSEDKERKKVSGPSNPSNEAFDELNANERPNVRRDRSDTPTNYNPGAFGPANKVLSDDTIEEASNSKIWLEMGVDQSTFSKKPFDDIDTSYDQWVERPRANNFKPEGAFEESTPLPMTQGKNPSGTDSEGPTEANTPGSDHRNRTSRAPKPPKAHVGRSSDGYEEKTSPTASQDPHTPIDGYRREEKTSLPSRLGTFKVRSLNSGFEGTSRRGKPLDNDEGMADGGDGSGVNHLTKSILKYRLGSGNLGKDLKFKGEEPLGLAIGVLGVGGSGASTIAMAIAQSFAGEHRVNLVDLVVEGSQRMYHDIDVVQPGVTEAIAGSRVMNVGDDYFERFKIPILERGYLLMLAISHQNQLEALRRSDLGEAIERIGRTSDITIFDLDPDFATASIRDWATITPTAPTEEVLREIDAVIIVVNEDYRSLHRGVSLGRRLIEEGFRPSQIAIVNNDNHQSTPSSIRQIRKLPELLEEYSSQRKDQRMDPLRSLRDDVPNEARAPIYIEVPYNKEVAKIHEEVRPFTANFLKKLQPLIQFCANASSFSSERSSTKDDFPLVRPQSRRER